MGKKKRLETTTEQLKRLQTSLLHTLYDDEAGGRPLHILAEVERVTHVKREQIVYSLAGLLSLYMVLGYFAELVCNAVGFVYPCYQSVQAIRTPDKRDDTEWLIYWSVFSVFSLVDFFSEKIMGVFPLYWLCKCLFLLYLYLPQFGGAQHLYTQVVDPGFVQLEQLCSMCAKQPVSITDRRQKKKKMETQETQETQSSTAALTHQQRPQPQPQLQSQRH